MLKRMLKILIGLFLLLAFLSTVRLFIQNQATGAAKTRLETNLTDPNLPYFPTLENPLTVEIGHTQITSLFREQVDASGKITNRVELYADRHFLGALQTNQPGWCDRSSDGFWLAYLDAAKPEQEVANRLRWVDLRNLEVQTFSPDLTVLPPVFWAPQGLQMAAVVCLSDEAKSCFLSLIDAENHTMRELAILPVDHDQIIHLLWNPNGTQIAILYGAVTFENIHDPQTLEVIDISILQKIKIFAIKDGDTVFEGIFDRKTWQVKGDSPLASWGVTFAKGLQSDFGRCHIETKKLQP